MRAIRIFVTNVCNSNNLKKTKNSPEVCGFCYRQTNTIKTSKKRIIRILNEIKKISLIKEITFTGGEPLVSEYLPFFLEESKKRGFYNIVHTNGILLKKLWKKISKNIDCVTLPIDGSNKLLVEYHRGKWFYDITQRNMNLLKKSGKDIAVNTIATKENIEDLKTLAKEINVLKLRYWLVSRFRKINLAACRETSDIYWVGKKNFIETMEHIEKKYRKINLFYQIDNNDGPKRIWICADGKVYTQKRGEKINTLIGDLNKTELSKIIKNHKK